MVLKRDAPARLGTAHDASGTAAAAVETFGAAPAAPDVAAFAHAAGDDVELARACAEAPLRMASSDSLDRLVAVLAARLVAHRDRALDLRAYPQERSRRIIRSRARSSSRHSRRATG